MRTKVRNYLIGVKLEYRKNIFNVISLNMLNVSTKRFKFWTNYKVIVGDTIWLRELEGDGHVYAKGILVNDLGISHIDGNHYYEIQITDKCDISTRYMFRNYNITSNANHGIVR